MKYNNLNSLLNKKTYTVLLTIYLSVFSCMGHAADKNEEAPRPPVKVKPVMPSKVIPTTTVTGHIYSRHTLQVMAGVDEQLEWVIEPGSYVNKGETLVRFNQQRLQLEQAEQEALIQRERDQLTYLNREVKRLQALQAANAISQDAVDKALSRRDLVRSDLKVAESRLALINNRLSKSIIYAPFTGVIMDRFHLPGEEVRRGDVITTLKDTQNLELRAFVPLEYFSYVHRGSELSLSQAYAQSPKTTVQAKIRTVIPNSDIKSQTFEVRIDIPPLDQQQWTIGQLLNAKLPIAPKSRLLAVHRDAILLRAQGNYVVKVSSDNIAQSVPVTLGDAEGEWIEVIGALKAGDNVAVKGAERLRDEQTVSIEAESDA